MTDARITLSNKMSRPAWEKIAQRILWNAALKTKPAYAKSFKLYITKSAIGFV
jgi:hypothetical protein